MDIVCHLHAPSIGANRLGPANGRFGPILLKNALVETVKVH
jgi:hypothetical protein